MMQMQELIARMVQAVVDTPEQVCVTVEAKGEVQTFHVRVAPTEIGQVLGKSGRIAEAIRTIAKACAMKDKRKVYVAVDAQPAEAPRCDQPGCAETGFAVYLPDSDEPFAHYCSEHAFGNGFCPGCALFWAGCESFDFGGGLCDNCRSSL